MDSAYDLAYAIFRLRREIFEDERRGRIGRFGNQIEFGEIEIRDHFGSPRVRRK